MLVALPVTEEWCACCEMGNDPQFRASVERLEHVQPRSTDSVIRRLKPY